MINLWSYNTKKEYIIHVMHFTEKKIDENRKKLLRNIRTVVEVTIIYCNIFSNLFRDIHLINMIYEKMFSDTMMQ